MNTVKVKNIEIGKGITKLCVPIIGKTTKEILDSAEAVVRSGADLAEWRADWYREVLDECERRTVLESLRMKLDEMPLLFTFRTAEEGGEKQIDPEQYVNLNKSVAESGCVDLVDVELSAGDSRVMEIIEAAHRNDVKVIVSSHDFVTTPDKEEMISRLKKMQTLGGDISKIAVMPENRKDVLTLLAATEEMTSKYADRPVISMSMSEKGLITRLCGEVFGSAVTFGTAGKASAPGQIDAQEIAGVLKLLHENMK